MIRRQIDRIPTVARIALTIAAAAALTGCASSSRTTLGLNNGAVYQDGMGVGDGLGASMFREHVRLAAADIRQQRALKSNIATVRVPTD